MAVIELARSHQPKKMRQLVLIILLVMTGGLARPRVDSSTRHLQKQYGSPILRSVVKSAAFPRRRLPIEEEEGRRQGRSLDDGELAEDPEVLEAFALYDVDGDGVVSEKEFELYDSHEEYETADHDTDGNGSLDLEEFAKWYSGPLEDEDMDDIFEHIDVDASGLLSTSELLQFLIDEGLEEEAHFIKVIVRGYDADGDSVLDRKEFETFMTEEDEEDAIDR